ncbi:MAG: septum formation protein Maf [Proteobacteria bacterium]|nr:MAG: septum formation protein Maf [Pseudomonadota bacterium]
MQPQLILASASPRRRELLQQIGIAHRVQTADVDESAQTTEFPPALVQRLARQKAEAVWQCSDQTLPVLGADTLGVLDGELLVKPRDFAHARQMLLSMAGRSHIIFSAVALCHQGGCALALNQSQVWFRAISEAEVQAYWDSGEPQDKAGAYGIQGLGAVLVERLEGSYSAVMGLPLFETAQLLQQHGIYPL